VCSAWKKWIRNPTTHPSNLWIPNLAAHNFWAFPTMKRELQGKKITCSTILLKLVAVCSTFLRSGRGVVRSALLANGGNSKKKRLSLHLQKVLTQSNKVSPRTFQTALVYWKFM
jgi:hypothetical protein